MFKLHDVLREEASFDGDSGGEGEFDSGFPSEGEAESEPSYFLRDLTEDDAYERMQHVREFPDQLKALESRVFGSFGPVSEKLRNIEQSLGTRQAFDASKIQAVLDQYDPELSKQLVPALTEAFSPSPLDEATLSPYLDPVRDQMQTWMGEQIVLASYDPETIAEIIPETQNGQWSPANQRQKDFVQWFGSQGHQTQQDLQRFGAPYVQALRKFEKWEQDRIKEREKAAGAKSSRMQGGQQPTAQGRRGKVAGPQTAEEAMLAGFNEVFGTN